MDEYQEEDRQPDNDMTDTDSSDNSGSEMSVVPVQPSALVTGAEDWNQIVDQLVNELSKDDLPDKVIRATELLLAGYPTYKAAQKLSISPATIRRWLSRYPTMAAIVHNGKKLLSKWRMSVLEQQFLAAAERSQEILDVNLDGTFTDEDGNLCSVNPKVLTVVAAQARYILGLFAGQRIDINVTHELGDTVLKAKADALDYIAERLAEQDSRADSEPIEAVFRVVDPKMDDSGPYLDEDGKPPFGEMGVLDRNEDGSLCHICGQRFKQLRNHLANKHNCQVDEYENLYLLDDGDVRRKDEK